MKQKIKAYIRRFVHRRNGQVTIEYVLMLGSILVVLSAFISAFHQDIVFWFFSFLGQMLEK